MEKKHSENKKSPVLEESMFGKLRGLNKHISILVTLVFLFVQIIPALAASNQYSDPNVDYEGNQLVTFTNGSNTAVLGTADSLSNYYLNQYKNNLGWDWLKTTNINFTAFSGSTPQWSINTFQPLSLNNGLDKFFFAQGQYSTANNTVNIGAGLRRMNSEHSSMYGFNLFYDWQPAVQGEGSYIPGGAGHMRLGAGAEYFTGSIESRLNAYYGISSDIQVGAADPVTGLSAWQAVAPGLDFSVGTDFSFWNAPWLKLTATGSWYMQQYGGTINGFQGSPLTASINASLQVVPQLSVTAGGTFGNGAASNGNVGFQFNLLAPPQPALFMADPEINKLAKTDISYKMLQPVQRNNTITVERYTKQTGSTAVTFVIRVLDSQGNPVQGAQVSASKKAVTAAVNTGGDTAATQVTDSSGCATFTNMAQGTYSATAKYGDTSTTFADVNIATPDAKIDGKMDNFGGYRVNDVFTAADKGGYGVLRETTSEVVAYDQDGNLVNWNWNMSNAVDGNDLVIRGLKPGQKYTFNYKHGNLQDTINPSIPASTMPGVDAARAVPAQDVQITPDDMGNIRVKVTYSDGTTPVENEPVLVSGLELTRSTDSAGVVNFIAAAGNYTISLPNRENPSVSKTVTNAMTATATFTLTDAAPAVKSKVTVNPAKYNNGSGEELANGVILTVKDKNGNTRDAGYTAGSGASFGNLYAQSGNEPYQLFMGSTELGTDKAIVPDGNALTVSGKIAGNARHEGNIYIGKITYSDGTEFYSDEQITLYDNNGALIATQPYVPQTGVAFTAVPFNTAQTGYVIKCGDYTLTLKPSPVVITSSHAEYYGVAASGKVKPVNNYGTIILNPVYYAPLPGAAAGVVEIPSASEVALMKNGATVATAMYIRGKGAKFDNMAYDSYAVEATVGGAAPESVTGSGQYWNEGGTEIELKTPSAEVSGNLTKTTPPVTTGSAAVTVTDDADAIVPGASVQLYQSGQPAGEPQTTGGDGIASFSDITIGYYTAKAAKTGYVGADSASFQITATKSGTASVTLPRRGNLTGTVSDSISGVGLENATVTLLSGDGGKLWTVTSRTGGTYTFADETDITYGTYTLQVAKTGYITSAPLEVKVEAATVQNVQLQPLTGTITINSVVLSNGGAAPTDGSVTIFLYDNETRIKSEVYSGKQIVFAGLDSQERYRVLWQWSQGVANPWPVTTGLSADSDTGDIGLSLSRIYETGTVIDAAQIGPIAVVYTESDYSGTVTDLLGGRAHTVAMVGLDRAALFTGLSAGNHCFFETAKPQMRSEVLELSSNSCTVYGVRLEVNGVVSISKITRTDTGAEISGSSLVKLYDVTNQRDCTDPVSYAVQKSGAWTMSPGALGMTYAIKVQLDGQGQWYQADPAFVPTKDNPVIKYTGSIEPSGSNTIIFGALGNTTGVDLSGKEVRLISESGVLTHTGLDFNPAGMTITAPSAGKYCVFVGYGDQNDQPVLITNNTDPSAVSSANGWVSTGADTKTGYGARRSVIVNTDSTGQTVTISAASFGTLTGTSFGAEGSYRMAFVNLPSGEQISVISPYSTQFTLAAGYVMQFVNKPVENSITLNSMKRVSDGSAVPADGSVKVCIRDSASRDYFQDQAWLGVPIVFTGLASGHTYEIDYGPVIGYEMPVMTNANTGMDSLELKNCVSMFVPFSIGSVVDAQTGPVAAVQVQNSDTGTVTDTGTGMKRTIIDINTGSGAARMALFALNTAGIHTFALTDAPTRSTVVNITPDWYSGSGTIQPDTGYSATATKIFTGSGSEIPAGTTVTLEKYTGVYWNSGESRAYSTSSGVTFSGLSDGQYRFCAVVGGSRIPSREENYFTLSASQKNYSGTATLLNTGTVVVNFTTNAKNYGKLVRLQLFVNNDRWYNKTVDGSGSVTFENIPAGTYQINANYVGERIYGSTKFASDIIVTSGDTTTTSFTSNMAHVTVICKDSSGQQVYGSDVTAAVDDKSSSFVVDSLSKQVLVWQIPYANPRSFFANIKGVDALTKQNISGDDTVVLNAP